MPDVDVLGEAVAGIGVRGFDADGVRGFVARPGVRGFAIDSFAAKARGEAAGALDTGVEDFSDLSGVFGLEAVAVASAREEPTDVREPPIGGLPLLFEAAAAADFAFASDAR